MDKKWMTLAETTNGRMSDDYTDGVFAFVEYAKGVADREGKIRCPCKKCRNAYWCEQPTVVGHLITNGIMQAYTVWDYHGETSASTVRVEVQGDDIEMSGIDALVEDRIRADVVRLEAQLQQRDAQHQQLETQRHQLLAELKLRDDQLDAQRLAIEEQQKKIDSMMEFMRQMGYKEPPPPPSDG